MKDIKTAQFAQKREQTRFLNQGKRTINSWSWNNYGYTREIDVKVILLHTSSKKTEEPKTTETPTTEEPTKPEAPKTAGSKTTEEPKR